MSVFSVSLVPIMENNLISLDRILVEIVVEVVVLISKNIYLKRSIESVI